MKTQITISQKDGLQGRFGYVNRSSGIFYFKQTGDFRTLICFMDYWSVKRDVKVLVMASTRDMDGNLIKREELNFEEAMVHNYAPELEGDFEGSVEIEVFATQNMVIPFSAIMAVYIAPNSTSMVHTYGRVYSPHEIEEGRTITVGRESCWTIKDSDSVRSIGVFHNGHKTQPAQDVTLRVINSKGDSKEVTFEMDALPAYATRAVYPEDYIEDLAAFLDGEAGNASLSFDLCDAFTRMLVGNETKDGRELQVTHSNFNYSAHSSDSIEGFNEAYMDIATAQFKGAKVIVYPDSAKGSYQAITQNGVVTFTNEDRTEIDVAPGERLVFKPANDGEKMPTRIVTAFSAEPHNNDVVLPFECSLGVKHKEIPMKRSHWGLITSGVPGRGMVYAVTAPEIFGELPQEDLYFNIAIYSAISRDVREVDLSYEQVKAMAEGTDIKDIFEDADEFFGGKYGHFYIKTSYPGFTCYSLLEDSNGSMTFEHSF